jgi:protein-L-isoaspartate O-methyltransferase
MNMKDTKNLVNELWDLMNNSRSSYAIGDIEIFEQWITSTDIEELEVRLSVWNDVMKNNRQQNQGEFVTKPDVANFITQLIGKNKYNRILDPACGTGYLLSKLASSCEAKEVHGIEINQRVHELALRLHNNINIRNLDSCFADLSGNEFDLIISELPLGVRIPPFLSDWLDIMITEGSMGIMANSLKHLSTNGTAIFSCLESMFWTAKGVKFLQSLRDNGYYFNAVFQQPNSRLNTAVTTCLMVITRKETEKLFVAQCSDDQDANEKIILNFNNSNSNERFPANGVTIQHDLFRGFDALQAGAKLTKIAKDRSYKIHNYEDIVVTRKIYDIKEVDEIVPLPNSIFFNMIFPKKIYLSIEEFDRKTGKVCNIQFKEEIIKASTLKALYDQEILESTFSQIAFGSTHKNISINNLSQMKIIAPDKYEAVESEEFLRKINSARLRLDDLESVVRNDFIKSKNEITILDNFGNFLSWVDTLPFPLATLLKKFTAEENSTNKSKILIEFFENLAIVVGTIHLSARWNELEGESELKSKVMAQLKKNKLSFHNATFGLWRTVIDILSADSEKMYKDQETKSQIFQKYCTSNSQMLNFLLSKSCRRIIGSANTYRNDKDHNRKSGMELLESLNELVIQFRGEIGRSFSNYELISPIGGLYKNGLFNCKTLILNGHSVIWSSKDYITRTPLEANELYFHSKFDNLSLKLLPLIVLRSTPSSDKNAVYMHNKISNEKQLLVAHHLSSDKTLEENMAGVEFLMDEFSID